MRSATAAGGRSTVRFLSDLHMRWRRTGWLTTQSDSNPSPKAIFERTGKIQGKWQIEPENYEPDHQRPDA
jgi:hypothetical protein